MHQSQPFQQIINTELAAGATTAQTGIFGLPAAQAIRAVGYASVGLIAAQTIAGFKSGGYTGNYGTSQVAGVVHGQEYVLNAEATKRVGKGTLDALNSGASIGDEININVILNISNDGSSTTQVNGQAAKEKELASVIANAVRAIIIKEKRQGGLLS
jgi:lambda family phage tail tape measure protein